MNSSSFYTEGTKLLTANAFEFVLDWELKRAARSQNFVTLVTIAANREWDGCEVAADLGMLQEVADIIRREVRATDPIGHTDKPALTLALLDADFEHSIRVIERIVARIENYKFPTVIRIAIGAACCPTHAVDVHTLKRQAWSQAIVNCGVRHIGSSS
jgi:GGDEF domain-containing protein